MHEECGIVYIYNVNNISLKIYNSALSLQHRGQNSFGISIFDKISNLICLRRNGKIDSESNKSLTNALTFSENRQYAIAHTRYATSGSLDISNIQPFYGEFLSIKILISFNGNISNYKKLLTYIKDENIKLKTDTDTELIIALISLYIHQEYQLLNKDINQPDRNIYLKCLLKAQNELHGGYSCIIIINDLHFILRDRYGIRPMCMGNGIKGDKSLIIVSETCAIDAIEGVFIREIYPGEISSIIENELHIYHKNNKGHHCVFEHVYFAKPESYMNNIYVQQFRRKLGHLIADKIKDKIKDIDVVFPVPSSSNMVALGLSERSGINMEYGIIKNYSYRTFIAYNSSREDYIKAKYTIVTDIIKNKNVLVVDDSIVRGATFRALIKRIYASGAKSVHAAISSPRVTSPCYYGVDTPDKAELIGSYMNEDEIANEFNLSSLLYVTVEDMSKVLNHKGICSSCFTGKYLY